MSQPLTTAERVAVVSLLENDAKLKTLGERLEADHAKVMAEIEDRLGLESGAIGKTHVVDITSGTVEAKAEPEGD